MYKVVIGALLAVCVAGGANAKNHNQTVTVEIVAGTNTELGNGGSEGVAGGIAGRRTKVEQQTVNAIINGQHVLLDCKENHHGCFTLGPGKYSGELKVDRGYDGKDTVNVWISYAVPLTNATQRDHYLVAGSW